MTNHYLTIGVESGAKQEEVQAAFDAALAARRARRQRTSDLHAAFAVLGDPTLRRAYDLARFGVAASDKLVHVKATTVEFARDAMPGIDAREVAAQAHDVALKMTYLGAGGLARVADATAGASRAVQRAVGHRLGR